MKHKLIKVDRFKHDNLKIPKEKLENLSLSGNDYVGHVKPKQSKEKHSTSRDNLKLATGKLEDSTTNNTDFKVPLHLSCSRAKTKCYCKSMKKCNFFLFCCFFRAIVVKVLLVASQAGTNSRIHQSPMAEHKMCLQQFKYIYV